MIARRAVLAGLATLPAACGGRAVFTEGRAGGPSRDILLLTNRLDGEAGLGRGRGDGLRVARLRVALPAERAPGALDYRAAGLGLLSSTRADPARPLAGLEPGPVTLWVHGFNNTPAEAVYRHAQMAEDLALPGAQVAFVWPSNERYSGYLHDRDSVLHARAPFADALRLVRAARPGAPLFVIAHSLGAFLAMEGLRTEALAGRPLSDGVRLVLLQPDIDPAVLVAQAVEIGTLPDRMLVLTAADDPALRLSARLAGQPARAGASAAALAPLRAMGVRVLDLTDIGDAADPHLAALTSPTAIALIRAFGAGRAA